MSQNSVISYSPAETIDTPRHASGDSFQTHLRYENIVKRPYWFRLKVELVYWSERLRELIIVPIGYETNLASIPRPLWGIYPPHNPKYAPAAGVHDYLYATQTVSRRQADLVFRDAMRAHGVNWFRRHGFYAAVRAGGAKAWREAGERYRREHGAE